MIGGGMSLTANEEPDHGLAATWASGHGAHETLQLQSLNPDKCTCCRVAVPAGNRMKLVRERDTQRGQSTMSQAKFINV